MGWCVMAMRKNSRTPPFKARARTDSPAYARRSQWQQFLYKRPADEYTGRKPSDARCMDLPQYFAPNAHPAIAGPCPAQLDPGSPSSWEDLCGSVVSGHCMMFVEKSFLSFLGSWFKIVVSRHYFWVLCAEPLSTIGNGS